MGVPWGYGRTYKYRLHIEYARERRRVLVRDRQLADEAAAVLVREIKVVLGRVVYAVDGGVDFSVEADSVGGGGAASTKNGDVIYVRQVFSLYHVEDATQR